MVEPAALAYPALVLATYAIYRVGRRRQAALGDPLEWWRTLCLAVLVGIVLAMQVRFAVFGISDFATRASAAFSAAALVALMGLHAYERAMAWSAASARAAAPPPEGA